MRFPEHLLRRHDAKSIPVMRGCVPSFSQLQVTTWSVSCREFLDYFLQPN